MSVFVPSHYAPICNAAAHHNLERAARRCFRGVNISAGWVSVARPFRVSSAQVPPRLANARYNFQKTKSKPQLVIRSLCNCYREPAHEPARNSRPSSRHWLLLRPKPLRHRSHPGPPPALRHNRSPAIHARPGASVGFNHRLRHVRHRISRRQNPLRRHHLGRHPHLHPSARRRRPGLRGHRRRSAQNGAGAPHC